MTFGPFSDIVISSATNSASRVPGFRESQIAETFLKPQDFGMVAIWHPATGSQSPLRGIFDAEYQGVDPGTGQVMNFAPQFQVSTLEIPEMKRDDRLEFSGLFYRVREIKHDGTGITTLDLSKDKAK